MKKSIRILAGAAALAMTLAAAADSLQGKIEWSRRVAVNTGVSGQVRAIHVTPGEAVVAGQVLVELDPVLFQIRVRQARSQEALYAAELDAQQADFEREQALFDEGSLSTVQLKLEQLSLSRALAAHTFAVLELERAQHRLDLTRLKAPFDAWVIESSFELGAYAASDAEAPATVILAERGVYAAHLLADRALANRLVAGTAVTVRVSGQRFAGTVAGTGLEPTTTVDGVTGYLVTIRFESRALIRAGTPCAVDLP